MITCGLLLIIIQTVNTAPKATLKAVHGAVPEDKLDGRQVRSFWDYGENEGKCNPHTRLLEHPRKKGDISCKI